MAICLDCKYYFSNQYTRGYCNLRGVHMILNTPACIDFQPPEYESSSNDGCFITTACMEYMGKKDDCEELQIMRKFRDEYMKSNTEGQKLIKQYYEVAPKIVSALNANKDKDYYYGYILNKIQECLTLIANEKYDDAQKIYYNMGLHLAEALNIKI